MPPRYRVTLTEQERSELDALTKRGKISARKFVHARALLLCDAGDGGPAWKVADTAEALGISSRTIEHIKKQFVEEGLGKRRLIRNYHRRSPVIKFHVNFSLVRFDFGFLWPYFLIQVLYEGVSPSFCSLWAQLPPDHIQIAQGE